MYTIVPDQTLKPDCNISAQFIQAGITSFHLACEYVWKLPYGRPADIDDPFAVLTEQKGTCSGKHFLIKILADALNIPLDLVAAIYLMTPQNTPEITDILKANELDSIPEAHCYLRYQNNKIDLTHYRSEPPESTTEYLFEKPIQPTPQAKAAYHQAYIKQQFGVENLKKIWAIRENCIQRLQQR